jgi:hypothetical protein
MPQSEVPEGFVRLAHALVESEDLRSWFYQLAKLSPDDRAATFLDMARHIYSEDDDLAVIAFKLREPKIYQALLRAVRERVDESTGST